MPDAPARPPALPRPADRGLHALGIPRLDRDRDLSGLRPEIPLSELVAGRLDRLLALIDRWIADVRAHATEPETTTGE